MKRADYDDQNAPGYEASLPTGHYATGFSAIIKDGIPQEPVSTLGPIGFVTRPLTPAALKRLKKARKTDA